MRRAQQGFSLLELAVVVCLIAILVAIAADRLWALRVDAERVAVAHTVGAIRSALGIEVARRAVQGGLDNMAELDGANPMSLLAQKPGGYLGEKHDPDPASIPEGRWYFDTESGLLVYRVRFEEQLTTSVPGPARLRFRLKLRYTDRNGNGQYDRATDGLSGLDLVAVDPYQWRGTGPATQAVPAAGS